MSAGCPFPRAPADHAFDEDTEPGLPVSVL